MKRIGLAALCGAVVVGCAPPDAAPPSIVLWIVDTLRVDRLGLYGFERPVSPNYDALAAQSTVFEAATAQSSWTRPTVATLLTGVGPIRHGVTRIEHSLGDEWGLLPERLRDLGYATAGFSANGNVSRDTGFDQGFDDFWFSSKATAETLVERALGWLDSVRAETPDRPFFIMILSIEPHHGYEPPRHFRERFAGEVVDRRLGTRQHITALINKEEEADPDIVRQLFQLYEAEIAWSDHEFGAFRRMLDQRGLSPAIIVTADHGEEFGEHGRWAHRSLHREVLHIPFFVHLPGQTKGSRVRLPVQQADVLPTLVDLAGGSLGEDVAGLSLVPLLSGRGPYGPASPLAETLRTRPIVSVHGGLSRPIYSLVVGRWKLIEERRPRGATSDVFLFDRVNDPEELVDLAGERPSLAKQLLRVLHEEVEIAESGAVDSIEVTLDDETRRQLQALGYLE